MQKKTDMLKTVGGEASLNQDIYRQKGKEQKKQRGRERCLRGGSVKKRGTLLTPLQGGGGLQKRNRINEKGDYIYASS